MEITANLIRAMLAEADQAHPNECCGILLGEGDTITQLAPTANIHQTPATHFEIDPSALITAHKAQRDGGPEIIGYYHSHPVGLPEPSDTDQSTAAGDGRAWAIIGQSEAGSDTGRDVKFWRDAPSGFEPLSYAVIGD